MIRAAWNYFKRDPLRRAVALLFAIMIYWSISAQISEERFISGVPIEYRLDSGLILTSASRYDAAITVRGSRRDLNDLDASAIVARVQVNSSHRMPDGSYRIQLHPNDFLLNRSGLSVVRVELPRDGVLSLRMTRRISRSVKVKPRFAGKLAPEYRLADWRVIPDEVRISGPENVVAEVREVITEPIPLSPAVEEAFEYDAVLSTPGRTSLSPGRAMVQVDVVRNIEQRTFKQLPVQIMGEPGSSVTALPAEPGTRVDVTLTGSIAALSALSPDDVRPFVRLSGVGVPGIHALPVELYVKGGGVGVKTIAPGEIKVKSTRVSSK